MDVSFSLPTISDAISDIAASFLCKWIFSARIVGRCTGCVSQALLRRGICLWLSECVVRFCREFGRGAKERLEWPLAARYQDEIVSPFCETIRVDGADTVRGAGDEGGAL